MAISSRSFLLILIVVVILFASHAHAFGAGNIASISAIEGKNWRHGDLEDLLKQVSCIKHHKWNTMMIKRTYFGNWLRDYSQAMDVGTLKKANSETIRILVWLLSFLGFGYATAEFEVTSERLGVYRPEEHIDNPKDYNDNEDARKWDPRLRGPIRQVELDIDPQTGMKNYIANGKGDWATSSAFVKYSFERSIHYGRSYIGGSGFMSKGKDEDLAEALRCLGQGLHTLEDFGAHTNYVELALIEMGHRNIFPLVGTRTGITLRGKHVFPLVTGTFGAVDFYHSVLGEASDHFTQSEVNEMDNAMGIAQQSASSSNPLTTLIKLLSKVPGTRDLCLEAEKLQQASQDQMRFNSSRGIGDDGMPSSRALDNQYEGSRSGPGDWNSQQPDHTSYNQQQPSQYGQHSQQWSQPATNQYHELPTDSYHQQQYGQDSQHQWQQPHQAAQWNNPQDPQSFNMQQSGHDQQGQSQWQQHQQDQAHQPSITPQATPADPAINPDGQQTQPQGLPGYPDFDPVKTIKQIYPILAFRDKVVRTISSVIEKIPGLEALVDRIVETLTVFILSLLAPFVRPLIKALTKTLQTGSSTVIDSSGKHQYEVWDNPSCSDPTHSMLSKDHFSNILNPPAGAVAGEILRYIAPRVLYAWENPNVPVERVMHDIEAIFHHPAIRDEGNECHRNMFNAVKKWEQSLPDRGSNLENVLSIQAVRDGKNHKDGVNEHAGHGSNMQQGGHGNPFGGAATGGSGGSQGGIGGYLNQAQSFVGNFSGQGSHGGSSQHQYGSGNQGSSGGYLQQAENLLGSFGGQGQHHGGGSNQGGLNEMLSMANKLPIPGVQNLTSTLGKFGSFIPGGRSRGLDDDNGEFGGQSREIQTTTVGGGLELHDAARRGEGAVSPMPTPLATPSGYEEYGGRGQAHEGSTYQSGQYQQGYDQQRYHGGGYEGGSNSYYNSGSGGEGGESGGYYRG